MRSILGLGASRELKSSCQASVLVMPGFRSGPGSEFNHNHLEAISSNQNNGEHIDQNLSDILGWHHGRGTGLFLRICHFHWYGSSFCSCLKGESAVPFLLAISIINMRQSSLMIWKT